jgi:membrane associated rhomboid family serine protease
MAHWDFGLSMLNYRQKQGATTMIDVTCKCGGVFSIAESEARAPISCAECGTVLNFVTGETLPDGAGAADFDARLVVTTGPDRVGEHILLGGVAELLVGKLPDKHISLAASKLVSRLHCKLQRLDFGPSRWTLADNQSTNGLFVNGEKIASRELEHGDEIRIGDYTLRYESAAFAAPPAAPPPPEPVYTGGPVCPRCQRGLAPGAKICIQCGIDVNTGRPIVIAKGLDEDDLAIRADTWIRVVSWIVPFGLFPVASEAFGTRRPITTWVVTIVTLIASIAYFIAATSADDEPSPAMMNLMHWTGSRQVSEQRLEHLPKRPKNLDELIDTIRATHIPPPEVGFRWYQLFTSVLLHDPSNVVALVFHLAGNLLFLWVFGMRVNELLGNVKFAIVYPLLAVGSGLVDMLAHRHAPLQAGLGASGVIMGLAGMYLVFFPVQRVHVAIWFRGGILTKWQCFYKLFSMRGFWLLVLWIAWNDGLPMILDLRDSVGHWAHVGGFATGVLLALVMLVARQADARRGDLLSVTLGRHAWPILGKPGGGAGNINVPHTSASLDLRAPRAAASN